MLHFAVILFLAAGASTAALAPGADPGVVQARILLNELRTREARRVIAQLESRMRGRIEPRVLRAEAAVLECKWDEAAGLLAEARGLQKSDATDVAILRLDRAIYYGKSSRPPGAACAGQPGFVAPVAVRRAAPAYPEEARARTVIGSVHLWTLIDERGIPRSIETLAAPGAGLGKAAAEALAQWRYTPARLGGASAACAILVTIEFVPGMSE